MDSSEFDDPTLDAITNILTDLDEEIIGEFSFFGKIFLCRKYYFRQPTFLYNHHHHNVHRT